MDDHARAKIDQLRAWVDDLRAAKEWADKSRKWALVDAKRAWKMFDALKEEFDDFKQSSLEPPKPKKTSYSMTGKVINVNFGL